MAKFSYSTIEVETPSVKAPEPKVEAPDTTLHDRPLGEIIRDTRNLSPDQVEEVLAYQRSKGVRFGEALIALRYATTDEVLHALSQQFHYPYATAERRVLSPELVVLNQPFSVQAETIRAIRSQITMRLFAEDGERRAVAVISPETRDGKSFFCANLAVALAQLGGRTLLVDGDLRGPRMHQVFGVSNSAGLSGVLSGRSETKVIQQIDGIPSLFLLPAGPTPPNPLELLERPTFGLLLRELVGKFDHVIVDTAAAQYGSDAVVTAARCGAALVIARRNRGKVAALQNLVGSLDASPAKMVGVVMNDF
jgi:protein-tyrosine kinase